MRKFALADAGAAFTTYELAEVLGRNTPAGRRAVTAMLKAEEFRKAEPQALESAGRPRAAYGLADTRRALVLRHLYRFGCATAGEIAKDIELSKQRTKSTLADLQAAGLVQSHERSGEMGTLFAVPMFADELGDYDEPAGDD